MISVVLTVAVQLAISRDGHSGGVVRTVVIRRDGAERSVITEREFVFGNYWCSTLSMLRFRNIRRCLSEMR